MVIRVAPMTPQRPQQGETNDKTVHTKSSATMGFLAHGMDRSPHGGTEATPLLNGQKNIDPNEELSLAFSIDLATKRSPTKVIPEDTNRFDYTDIVKKKYFEQAQEENYHSHSTSRRFIANDDTRFGEHGISTRIDPNDSSILSSDQSSLSSARRKNGNENSIHNIDKDKTCRGEHRSRSKAFRPETPPLTLYSNERIPPLASSSNDEPDTPNGINDHSGNPDIDESAGPLSPGPGMEMSFPDQQLYESNSLRAMTTSLQQKLSSEEIALVGSQGSAASSRGSVSTGTVSSLMKQPVLYSAIGSLEHVNRNSLTNLNKRFMAPSKEFCRPGATSGMMQPILIPPARQYDNRKNQFKGNNQSSTSGLHATIQSAAAEAKLDSKQEENVGVHSERDSVEMPNRNRAKVEYPNANHSTGSSKKKDEKSNYKAKDEPNNVNDEMLELRADKGSSQTKIRAKTLKNSGGKNKDESRKSKSTKRVSYDPSTKTRKSQSKKIEMFRPSSDAYTPRIERKKIKYKEAEARPSVQQMSSPMGTLQRPNFRDALRRVAMIIHQHIVKIESRFEQQGAQFTTDTPRRKTGTKDGLFHASMRDMFNEESYRTPTYKCNMARIPMARPGMVYGLRKIKVQYTIPSETEIYDFGHQLFKAVQLSPECSIVCLIYVERLMEVAKVPLLACTWRPIFMCGLLLASKVWQDLSSWNIEFSSVYPQFSLEAINKLELNFLRNVKWDLYISSSSYAKYYFALRSLTEKQDFRQRYNRMVGGVGNVAQAEALKVQERTERVKEEALLKLSRSM